MGESITYAEKLRSIGFSRPRDRRPKRTTDVHDAHEVTVTEHWSDRVDVKVHGIDTIRASRKDTASE